MKNLRLIHVLFALLALRVMASFIGVDRMPLMPVLGDEVIINDPAVTLALGGGPTAQSFAHSTLRLDQVYGHFPPLYMLTQAAILSTFGISALTLRLGGILAGNAAIFIVLQIGRRLREAGVLDRIGLLLVGIPLLLEPGFFAINRWARMDSLVAFLGVGSLYCLILYETSKSPRPTLYLLGALSMGGALATHFEAAVFFVPFALYSLARVRRLGYPYAMAGLAVALFVPVAACLLAWRDQWPVALQQMAAITSYAPRPGLRLKEFIDHVGQHDLRAAWDSGGMGLIIVLLAAAAFLVRAPSLIQDRSPKSGRNSWFWFFGLTAIVIIVIFQWILPASTTRFAVAEPIFLLSIGVSMTGLRNKNLWIGLILLAGLTIVEIAGLGAYVANAAASWTKRSPDRFDAALADYPADAKIVGDAKLWYALSRRSAKHAILYPYLDERKQWESDPALLDEYDVVMLVANDTLIDAASVTHPRRKSYSDGWDSFVILSR